MKVGPVSSVSYRVAQSKRSSVGETESERRLYVSHQTAKQRGPHHDTGIDPQNKARSAAASLVNAQLATSDQFQREMALNMGYELYQKATERPQTLQSAAVISLTV